MIVGSLMWSARILKDEVAGGIEQQPLCLESNMCSMTPGQPCRLKRYRNTPTSVVFTYLKLGT